MATAAKKAVAKKAAKKAVKKTVAKKAAVSVKPTRSLAELERVEADAQKMIDEARAEKAAFRKAESETVVKDLVKKITENRDYFTLANRNAIKRALEPEAAVKPSATGTGKNRIPKFKLPNGDTWAGTGRIKDSFLKWEKSAAGKVWKALKDRPARFPLNPEWEAAQKKA